MPQINVLSLDGGGVRGIITSRLLELFCALAGIPADKIYQYFNIIAGTSIGGIQALGYAKGLTPTYVKQLLIDNASTIFNCTYPIPGGGQASYGTWTGYLAGIYSSLYSQTPLANLINSNFGTDTINNYQTNVLVPAFQRSNANGTTNVPIYFSNIPSSIVPYFSGQTELSANVALATSAAPVYFPPAVFNGCTYVDGGIFLNNPAALALAAQKAVQPAINKFCVLSIGTGLGSIGYIPGEPTLRGPIDNLNTIKMVMDVSTAIPPEGVAVEQNILSNYALENLYYLRMQYQIDLSQEPDSSLDNSSPEFIQYMQDSATQYFSNNIESIANFIGHMFS
jgi:predicted acylesterase/phospholipase RssA